MLRPGPRVCQGRPDIVLASTASLTIENEVIKVSDMLDQMLNELEHAHIFFDELRLQNKTQKAAMQAMQAKNVAL